MSRSCSKCGIVAADEVRFCRHCGTPLQTAGRLDGHETISPLAQTVPLSNEGLTTSSLGADDGGGSASETGRVARAEMEQLLRRSRLAVETDGKMGADGNSALSSDYAAPPTGELTRETPVQASVPAAALSQAPAPATRRRSWMLMTGLLLLATLTGALLAYSFLRQRPNETAPAATTSENSNQAVASVNTNSTVGETGVHATELPPPVVMQPTPSASIEPTRDARSKPEREQTTQAPLPESTPKLTPTSSPVAVAQATPLPTPNSERREVATEDSSNNFYFQAVNILNGRDPRQLKRAELLHALQLFQNVKSGSNVAEARRQAARLGKELDRLNRQPRP